MLHTYEFWFVVGSQFLYGPEVLETVAARAAEHAFGLVGELLRHDQDALRRFFAERLHHAGRVLFSARTKPKLQHVPHLFLPIVTHAVRKEKPTPDHDVSCGLLKKTAQPKVPEGRKV